jgi:hypothetical protein
MFYFKDISAAWAEKFCRFNRFSPEIYHSKIEECVVCRNGAVPDERGAVHALPLPPQPDPPLPRREEI